MPVFGEFLLVKVRIARLGEIETDGSLGTVKG